MTKNALNTGKSVSLGSTLAQWPLRTVVVLLVLGAIIIEHRDLMGWPLNQPRKKHTRRP